MTKWRKIFGMFMFFYAGIEVHRWLTGGADVFFGMKWLLPVFFLPMMYAGYLTIMRDRPKDETEI